MPFSRAYVELILRHVQEGQAEAALACLRGGVLPAERDELLRRLAGNTGAVALAVVEELDLVADRISAARLFIQ